VVHDFNLQVLLLMKNLSMNLTSPNFEEQVSTCSFHFMSFRIHGLPTTTTTKPFGPKQVWVG
jgi:hypothetical protein